MSSGGKNLQKAGLPLLRESVPLFGESGFTPKPDLVIRVAHR